MKKRKLKFKREDYVELVSVIVLAVLLLVVIAGYYELI